jgi:hypothetical protein
MHRQMEIMKQWGHILRSALPLNVGYQPVAFVMREHKYGEPRSPELKNAIYRLLAVNKEIADEEDIKAQ